ncbi:MAG: hypothetical protein E7609_03695 [Ruminococcaceae bacterium]|nr:hypothetical protein [Oscillospiraceae bacterium]
MTPATLGEKMLHYFKTAGCEGSEYKEDIPSFVRFAHTLGTTVGALRRFKEQNADFRAVWEECEEILCDRIIDGALHRRLDGSFAKFFLTARFGFAEKVEAEVEPFGVEILLKEPDL